MWWLWSPFKLASCQLTSRDIWLTTHHWAFAEDAVTWSPTVFYKLCCMKEIAFWSSVGLRCKCRPNIMSNLHIAGQLYKCVTVVVLWLATGRTEALQLSQETAVCTVCTAGTRDSRHSWGLLSNEPSYCIAQINWKNAFIAKGYVSQLIVYIFNVNSRHYVSPPSEGQVLPSPASIRQG